MATLINGNGNPAIYAQQDADLYNGIMGPRTRILNVGSKMAATIEDANTIAIADGVIITKEGRRVQVDVGNVDEFIIPTGQAGTTRYYIIGYHLYTDGSANQLCETFVQLMASGSETITEDEFREGATEVYVSLYRIEQTGLTLNDPEALLTVGDSVSQIEDDIDDIEGDIAQINSDLTEFGSATLLKEFTNTTSAEVTLNDNVNNYREILLVLLSKTNDQIYATSRLPLSIYKSTSMGFLAEIAETIGSSTTICYWRAYANYVNDTTARVLVVSTHPSDFSRGRLYGIK